MANTTLTLDIIGMTCAACSNRIEKKLNRMNHVQAKVNLTTEKQLSTMSLTIIISKIL